MDLKTAGERAEALTQHHAPAVETRLQRLIFHVKPRTGLFRGQTLDIAQHDRHAIDFRQFLDGRERGLAQLRPQQILVG